MSRLLGAALLIGSLALPGAASELVAPYVNTVREDVELMLDLADLTPHDYLIDLGSGDGRIVIAAARRGASGHGIELDASLIPLARRLAREAGVADRVAFQHADIFEADISGATVVTMYLFPDANLQMRARLLSELRPGTRVVSNAFHMGDWQPDARAQGRTSGGSMLWIIPADVGGNWRLHVGPRSLHLSIRQRYQQIEAQVTDGSDEISVREASLRGNQITLVLSDPDGTWRLHGHVGDDSMQGHAHPPPANPPAVVPWSATRCSGPTTGMSPGAGLATIQVPDQVPGQVPVQVGTGSSLTK